MIEVGGRTILTELDEKVDPRHTALVIIDMQKDFTDAGYWWDNLGQLETDPDKDLPTRVAEFIASARSYGVKIFHVNARYDPQFLNDAMLERMHRLKLTYEACQEGTEGAEPHEGCEQQPGDYLVIKHRYDAFFDTDLHMQLQSAGVRTLVVIGVAVHGCVDATFRHAYFHGYYVVVPPDLTGGASPEAHAVTMDSVDLMFGETAPSSDILAIWQASAPTAAFT